MSEPAPEDGDPPDLEMLLKISQGLVGPVDQAIETVSAMHAQWYRVWQENGIPENRAAGLLQIMVAAAFGASFTLSP